MTVIPDLIDRLRGLGVTLSVVPGPPERLVCRAPKNVLTQVILEEVRQHRDAILFALKSMAPQPPPSARCVPEPCWACRGTRFWSLGNGHWVCGTCHPPAPGALESGVIWRDGRPAPGVP